ncbi:MAG: hypothetical protein ACXW0H_07795, partial [Methylobacter sp.]
NQLTPFISNPMTFLYYYSMTAKRQRDNLERIIKPLTDITRLWLKKRIISEWKNLTTGHGSSTLHGIQFASQNLN